MIFAATWRILLSAAFLVADVWLCSDFQRPEALRGTAFSISIIPVIGSLDGGWKLFARPST